MPRGSSHCLGKMAAAGLPEDGAPALHNARRSVARWRCALSRETLYTLLSFAERLRRAFGSHRAVQGRRALLPGPSTSSLWTKTARARSRYTRRATRYTNMNTLFLMPEQRLFGPLGASQPARCTLSWSDRGSMDRALQLSSSSHAAVLRTPSRHPASPLDWRAKLTAPARRAALELFVEHLFERCASCLRAGRVCSRG